MHEFGHIFGAHDEYCPDACVPPNALAGYLGMINANACLATTSAAGSTRARRVGVVADGVNNPAKINGYTRGAWGWLDTDGDGLVEVRDTLPRSALTARVDAAGRVRLQGTVADVAMTRIWNGIAGASTA